MEHILTASKCIVRIVGDNMGRIQNCPKNLLGLWNQRMVMASRFDLDGNNGCFNFHRSSNRHDNHDDKQDNIVGIALRECCSKCIRLAKYRKYICTGHRRIRSNNSIVCSVGKLFGLQIHQIMDSDCSVMLTLHDRIV